MPRVRYDELLPQRASIYYIIINVHSRIINILYYLIIYTYTVVSSSRERDCSVRRSFRYIETFSPNKLWNYILSFFFFFTLSRSIIKKKYYYYYYYYYCVHFFSLKIWVTDGRRTVQNQRKKKKNDHNITTSSLKTRARVPLSVLYNIRLQLIKTRWRSMYTNNTRSRYKTVEFSHDLPRMWCPPLMCVCVCLCVWCVFR